MEKPTPGLNLPENLILASRSPRRKVLLESLGVSFRVETLKIEETWPENLEPIKIVEYLAQKKAKVINIEFPGSLILSADTLIVLDNKVLGKPSDQYEAFQMLTDLSGRSHQVITGVCLMDQRKTQTLNDTTLVSFKLLASAEIEYYINNFSPFDKAGAYGIQEWIGMIGIEHIEGSYFNVMGLPVHKVYDALLNWY
jgi:nucleoside triphosphate pyrophosphatase